MSPLVLSNTATQATTGTTVSATGKATSTTARLQSSLLLKMNDRDADEGTCLTELSISDCSYDHPELDNVQFRRSSEQHHHRICSDSIKLIGSGHDQHEEEEEMSQVSQHQSLEDGCSASLEADREQEDEDDDSQTQQADELTIRSHQHEATPSQHKRHFLLRGVSEPELSSHDGVRSVLVEESVSRFPSVPVAGTRIGRSISLPSNTSGPLVPISILKERVSDDKCVKTSRSAWKVLPKPDMTRIIRGCSEPVRSMQGPPRDESSRRRSSAVSFTEVKIRHYQQTIGDNPSVSYGPPISLDWDFEDNEPIDLEEYEETRQPRRTMRQMILSYYQRRNILTWQYGASENDLKQAKRAAKKIRSRRALTNVFLPAMPVEAAFESSVRKARRVFGGHSHSHNIPQQECI